MSNRKLSQAKETKNDEFYTRLCDIEEELQHYGDYLKDKTVYCNCDNPASSNFWVYFHTNFARLGLKRLQCTWYDPQSPALVAEYTGGYDADISKFDATQIHGDGDFKSEACVSILRAADLIVTNPPFSIARADYLPLLFSENKKFLIIGDLNWATYKSVFPYIKSGELRFGYNRVRSFEQPSGETAKMGNKIWYTNLDVRPDRTPCILGNHYTPEKYPMYLNCPAINVDRLLDIPVDYEPCWYHCEKADGCKFAETDGYTDEVICAKQCNGWIGVPVSYLPYHNPGKYDLLGTAGGHKSGEFFPSSLYIDAPTHTHTHTHTGARHKVFTRVIIRRRL